MANDSAREKAMAEFMHQERVDAAVKNSMPLTIDDLEFLKAYADSVAISVELIYSDGGWWIEKSEGTQWLLDEVLAHRRVR